MTVHIPAPRTLKAVFIFMCSFELHTAFSFFCQCACVCVFVSFPLTSLRTWLRSLLAQSVTGFKNLLWTNLLHIELIDAVPPLYSYQSYDIFINLQILFFFHSSSGEVFLNLIQEQFLFGISSIFLLFFVLSFYMWWYFSSYSFSNILYYSPLLFIHSFALLSFLVCIIIQCDQICCVFSSMMFVLALKNQQIMQSLCMLCVSVLVCS